MSKVITKRVKAFDNATWSVEMFETPLEAVAVSNGRSMTDSRFRNCRLPGGSYDEEGEKLGVHSWDEAVDLLTYGYNPMVKELKDISPELMGEGKRVSFRNSVEGFAPIVPLALMGVPNSMVSIRMKPIKTKVLDVYYDATVSAWATSAQIIKAGKLLLKALLTLEQAGYKFNLYSLMTFADPCMVGEAVLVKLKSSNQPLDLRKMSFMLAHPAALRVIGFDWYSRFPLGNYRSRYGTPLPCTYSEDEIIAGFNELTGRSSVTFCCQTLVTKNRWGGHDEEVVKYVKDKLTGGKSNDRR